MDNGNRRGIPLLTGRDNWVNWRFIIRAQMTDNDNALDVLDGHVNLNRNAGRNETPEQLDARVDNNRRYNDGNKFAYSLITRYIDPSIVSHIIGCTNARQVWITLSGLYEGASAADKADLSTQLLKLKQNATENIRKMVQRHDAPTHP